MEPQSRVTVHFGRLTFAGEVVYSTDKDTWFRTCVDLSPGEDQRREPRLLIQQNGVVTTLSDDRRPSSAPGVLTDLAVSGMCLDIPNEVAPGTMIYIELESDLVAGEVRRCVRKSADRFEAGVAITDVLSSRRAGSHHRGVLEKVRSRVADVILGHASDRQVRNHEQARSKVWP